MGFEEAQERRARQAMTRPPARPTPPPAHPPPAPGQARAFPEPAAPATATPDLEQQIRQQWGQYGNWDIKGVNRAKELADLLGLHGVTTLGDVSLIRNDPVLSHYNVVGAGESSEGRLEPVYVSRDQFKIGDKVLGYLGDYNLNDTFGSKAEQYLKGDNLVGWSARGEGNVSYSLQQDPRTGKYYIGPSWGTSSDAPDVLPAIQLGLMFLPGLGQGLGALLTGGAASAASTALGNALISGTMAELSGGDFIKGAVGSGLGSLASGFVNPIAGDLGQSITSSTGSKFLGDVASGALTGATSSGIGALTSGRDISDALLSGVVGGGVSSGINSLIGEYGGELPKPIRDMAAKYLTGQLTSQILGDVGGGGGGYGGGGYGGGGGGAPSGGDGVIPSGGGGIPSGGAFGGASGLLSILPLLAMMDQQSEQPEQPQQMAVPQYIGAVKSPFGSILG